MKYWAQIVRLTENSRQECSDKDGNLFQLRSARRQMIVTKSLIQNRRTGQLLQRNEAGFWMADEERIPCLGRSNLEYSIKISQRIENVDYCD